MTAVMDTEIIRQANQNSLSCKDKILSENHKPPPFETEAWFFAKIFIDPKLGTLPPTS